MQNLKSKLKKSLHPSLFAFLKFIWNKDAIAFINFFKDRHIPLPLNEKLRILRRLYSISTHVDSPHTQTEILSYMTAILKIPTGVEGKIIEAGCFKGSSTAKFSIAVSKVHRELIVLDSFEGIPLNDEPHEKTIFGDGASFKQGDFCGKLSEVTSNVEKFGDISCCRFIKGWFDDSLPDFKEKIAAVYIDVDLASSTKTCLKYLYPLLISGGVLYSQDGHLPLVVDVFNDDEFWEKEVGYKKPLIEGLNVRKLIKITKQ